MPPARFLCSRRSLRRFCKRCVRSSVSSELPRASKISALRAGRHVHRPLHGIQHKLGKAVGETNRAFSAPQPRPAYIADSSPSVYVYLTTSLSEWLSVSLCSTTQRHNTGPCHRSNGEQGRKSSAIFLRTAGRQRFSTTILVARHISAILGKLPADISFSGQSQLPPAANTNGASKYCFRFSLLIPPVGIKRISGNGPFSAFIAGRPP